MKGILGEIKGVPVFEDATIPEGTYVCIDKDGLPIRRKDFDKKVMVKVIVHNFETFKIAMEHNKQFKESK